MTPQNDYEFIMNSSQKKASGFGAASKKQRIIVVLGGAILLIVVFMILMNLLSAGANKQKDTLVDLANYQTELARVITLGVDRSRDGDIKAEAVTASMTLETDRRKTVALMQEKGVGVPKEGLTKYRATQNDDALNAAEQAGNFDTVYSALYDEKLTAYKQKLQEVFSILTAASDKELVRSFNTNAKLLLGEPLEEQATQSPTGSSTE